MFATYTPQSHNALGDRTEGDFNTLTDLLLRLHYDFDYLDEDVLAEAELGNGAICVGNEAYELLILPPMAHLKLGTVERLERFVGGGGKLLGTIFLPDQAFVDRSQSAQRAQSQVDVDSSSVAAESSVASNPGMVDVSERIRALFGVGPGESQQNFREQLDIAIIEREHAGGGKASFVRSYALARQLPTRLQRELGAPGRAESPFFVIETEGDTSRYYFAPPAGERQEITAEVLAERAAAAETLGQAIAGLIVPDVAIDNPEIFYLHRVKNGQDLYFLVNPTFGAQHAHVTLTGNLRPVLWDPSTGAERPIAPWRFSGGNTEF